MPVLKKKIEGKALVTGASGFIGGNLRDALLDAGAEVITIRRKSSPAPKDASRSLVVEYDDVDGLAHLVMVEKPDWVFHVAGATKGVTYEDFQRANVMPTKSLLAALMREHPGVKRFVLVSSLTAYGPSSPDRPLEESDPRRPIEHYGRSKLEAEQVVEAIGDALPWTIVRPSGVYGPGDVDYFNLFREVAAGRNVFFGNERRWFSAIYVDDCVRAIVDAAMDEHTIGKGYFLCDGRPITWGQFQQAIVDASGRKVRTLRLPEALVGVAATFGELATKVDKKPRLFNKQKAKMGAQEAWTCTHRAAREDFGYHPEVQLAEGVERTLAWYREKRWI